MVVSRTDNSLAIAIVCLLLIVITMATCIFIYLHLPVHRRRSGQRANYRPRLVTDRHQFDV